MHPIHRFRWVMVLGAAGIVALSCARGRLRLPSLTTQYAQPVAVATGPRIDHAAHMEKGLECADCHMKDAKGADKNEPKPPTYAACADCHDEEDDKKPPEKKIKNLFFAADGSPKWTQAIASYGGDVTFRHGPHVAKVACASCHGEMKGTDRFTGMRFSMESCMSCHAQKGASNDCAVCHRDIRIDVPPASHAQLWTERHGQVSRSASERAAGRCDLCHVKPQWCERCHREEKPRSHNQLWRQKTHGIMASIDRVSCQACHQTDYCVRCHQETAPRSHRAQWATGIARHCTECHFPIQSEESCRVCHKTQPQHDSAPDMPSWHTSGMNCRLCHNATGAGGAPPLRHYDNGTQCQLCHH